MNHTSPHDLSSPSTALLGRPVRRRLAFTLIELLIVIAIIAILAGMVFPITKALNRTKLRTRARSELIQFETAIDSYKSKLGTYPPDNPNNFAINPLYYELSGTTLKTLGGAQYYETLDGASRVPADRTFFSSVFGPRVSGFVNCTKTAGGDEGPMAYNFLQGRALNANQVGQFNNARLIISSVPWPQDNAYQPVPSGKGMNPWRYNSSNPTNNPGSYDLWIDVIIDGKTNRIGNWSREPLIVNTP